MKTIKTLVMILALGLGGLAFAQGNDSNYTPECSMANATAACCATAAGCCKSDAKCCAAEKSCCDDKKCGGDAACCKEGQCCAEGKCSAKSDSKSAAGCCGPSCAKAKGDKS